MIGRPMLSFGTVDEGDDWRERALCAAVDPGIFFPEKGGSSAQAKRICAVCSVRPQCLAIALSRRERFGIWGGLSTRERDAIKRGESSFDECA